MTGLDIQPVLLGADLNCYNVARAFHEEYGVRSKAFGRFPVGATQNTRIIDYTNVPELDSPGVMIDTLREYAAANSGKKLILAGCTDEYVSLISHNRDRLEDLYIIPYINAELMDKITRKAEFYKLCEENGIEYPETVIFEKDTPRESLDAKQLGFSYPVIIKPSSSVLYWKHPFEGMKKVYCAENKEDAERIIAAIYASGYPDRLIIQDRIPGDDSHMYVLTSYSGSDGRVKMMCLGHVLLEEHTPKGLGNHAAIITVYNRELMLKFRDFLESVHYVGYSNFDIKYDERDGSYRAFEINVRQGRSNYYVTATGNNIARYIVEDYVTHTTGCDCVLNEKEIYWRYIPDSIVYRYTPEPLKSKVKALKKSGCASSSMRYKPDLRFNMKRRLFILLHEYHHFKKFRKYYHP